jgi:hypothetical protein
MGPITVESWSPADFCVDASHGAVRQGVGESAIAAYEMVCRTDFRAAGFCLIDLGAEFSSPALRRLMLALKGEMGKIHQSRTGRDLIYLSAARFDQQVSTKPHRDGGPDECFLMLGYEPSEVHSALALFDYSRCAFERGLTPSEFLARYNPMFTPGEQLLRPYSTPVVCFTNLNYQILMINNSVAPYSVDSPAWQGVLHTATVDNPSDSLRRIVNSTMIASVPGGTPEAVSVDQQEEFATTLAVRRRGYDKPHLEDDI